MGHNHIQHDPLIDPVRGVLLDKWDPLGVGDNPTLRDEYDAYLSEILQFLRNPSVTAQTISNYLARIEVDSLGLPGDPVKRTLAAETLIALAKTGQTGA
jgi:hypothetical protein